MDMIYETMTEESDLVLGQRERERRAKLSPNLVIGPTNELPSDQQMESDACVESTREPI